MFTQLSNLIPNKIDDKYKNSIKDFTRNTKLTAPRLIAFILSLVASDKNIGIDTFSSIFFKDIRKSELWENANTTDRSAITKARNKLLYTIFEMIEEKCVKLSYDRTKENSKFLWNGMNVLAIDGSKIQLPASNEIRNIYDKDSCTFSTCKSYYPQGLATVVFDVLRKIPIARSLSKFKSSEIETASELLHKVPQNSLILLDRMYPSYKLFMRIPNISKGQYIMRCKTASTFRAVENFLSGNKNDEIIEISPSKCRTKDLESEGYKISNIKIRAIKYISSTGEVNVLLTSLLDKNIYKAKHIIDLYKKRWEVEIQFRHEKCGVLVESFHSKSNNGILQEFYASGIVSIIAQIIINETSNSATKVDSNKSPFKHSIKLVASEIALFISNNIKAARSNFNELIKEIKRVIYHKPKNQRKTYPRFSKQPRNLWILKRRNYTSEN